MSLTFSHRTMRLSLRLRQKEFLRNIEPYVMVMGGESAVHITCRGNTNVVIQIWKSKMEVEANMVPSSTHFRTPQ